MPSDLDSAAGRIISGLPREVFDLAAQLGCDLSDVLTPFGVDLATLGRGDRWVSVDLHERLWAAAVARTGRPDLGVHAAARFAPGLTGIVESLLRHSETIADAVAAWLRFAPLVCDRISGALRLAGPLATLVWRLDRPDTPGTRPWAEFAQGRTLGLLREALRWPEAAPLGVHFRHRPPRDLAPYTDFFRAPLRFGAPDHALVLPAAWLDRPLRGADSGTRALLVERAHALEERAAQAPTVAAACRSVLEALLADAAPDLSLPRVAARLAMSPRSLQRHLRAEGATFAALRDQARRGRAQRLTGQVPQQALAALLGFQDDAALRKALRRWARDAP